LNVDGLIEGSVIRIGDRVRITAQLIDAPADRHLWAKSFERTSRDVLALQDDLAAAIAREINVQLTPREWALLTRARPVNPEAYDAYLRGQYLLNDPTPQNFKKALTDFGHAIDLDAHFALPFTGMSLVYSWAAWGGLADSTRPITASSKAKAAAEKALQLDNTLAEAHCALGVALENFFDWAGAEGELRRAIDLNPNYAYAHAQYGVMLAQLGRLDQALAESKRAVELDPLSPTNHQVLVFTLVWQGKYEAAMEQNRKASDLDPNSALWSIGWTNLQAGQFSQAIPDLQKAWAMGAVGTTAGYLGYAYAASGDRGKAMALIEDLRQQSSHQFISPACSATIYLGLGDRQRGLDGLEQAYETGDPWLMQMKMDKVFDQVRSDPRFINLLRKVHLDK
jgi:adenylate cyclase